MSSVPKMTAHKMSYCCPVCSADMTQVHDHEVCTNCFTQIRIEKVKPSWARVSFSVRPPYFQFPKNDFEKWFNKNASRTRKGAVCD